MKQKITFEMLWEDVEPAKAHNSCHCPVANCVKRTLTQLNVQIYHLRVVSWELSYRYAPFHEVELNWPDHVTKFIQNYDSGILIGLIAWEMELELP